jgi:glutamate dehydrogenase (NADP+)
VACDVAIPAALQNELNEDNAKDLIKGGCKMVCEAANMPCTPEAINAFIANKIVYAPGKAANAGGVATSGLEMTQNSIRLRWTKEEVDAKLLGIMQGIHHSCLEAAAKYGHPGNYMVGANVAGFLKVATAMKEQGHC